MNAERTPVQGPAYLRIADDIRIQIEEGVLKPGDSLPSLAELSETYGVSPNSARHSIALLSQQALITTRNGARPTVRARPRHITHSNLLVEREKAMVHAPEAERAAFGGLEQSIGIAIDETKFSATYSRVDADADSPFPDGLALLRREYETSEKESGRRLAWSVSFIPVELIESNPDLLDQEREPWPGGLQHQLSTVGIEVATVRNSITARAATTVEASQWEMPPGEPMLTVSGCMFDLDERIVHYGQVHYPADRTRLEYVTRLPLWRE